MSQAQVRLRRVEEKVIKRPRSDSDDRIYLIEPCVHSAVHGLHDARPITGQRPWANVIVAWRNSTNTNGLRPESCVMMCDRPCKPKTVLLGHPSPLPSCGVNLDLTRW
jgi:hypothetical protein